MQASRPRPIFGASARQVGATTASQVGVTTVSQVCATTASQAGATTASRVAAASSLLGATARLAGPSSLDSRHRLGAAALSPPSNRTGPTSPHDSLSPPSPCPLLQQPLNSRSAAGALVPSRARGRLTPRHEGGGSPGSSPHDSISPPDSPASNQRGDAYGPFARHHQIMTASGCKYVLVSDQNFVTPIPVGGDSSSSYISPSRLPPLPSYTPPALPRTTSCQPLDVEVNFCFT